jgi:hypothetical protein
MSGPRLNQPTAGSNAIGSFIIGVSPLGDIPQFDIWSTIISQWANSDALTEIIQDFNAAVDQTYNFQNFFDLMWNVDTAEGYGLDVWGRIVGVNRVLQVLIGPRYFGWEEGLPDYDPFNTSPFYSGEQLTGNYILNDDGFRVLILAKAYSNICDGSIQSINRLLNMLFGLSGKCYVIDNGDMSMVYRFEFPLTPLQAAILLNSGVMPRPTGVSVTVVQG